MTRARFDKLTALSQVEGKTQRRQVTGRGPSSRANARDLRRRFLALLETRISPGVYPELAEGVEMTTCTLCVFARDIPNFGSGPAALRLRGDGSLASNRDFRIQYQPHETLH